MSPNLNLSSALEINGTAAATASLLSRQLLFFQELSTFELLLAIFVFVVIRAQRQRKSQGLPVWPLLGMLPSLLSGLRTEPYEWISEVLCRQNGTMWFKGPWFSSINCVITCDPRNLEHLLKTKFAVFPKGPYFRDTVRDLLGDGIFNADDETWQRQRKTASTEFHSSEFRKLTKNSVFELVHHRLLLVLQTAAENSASVDLQDLLLRLTFDNVCMIAFGVDPGCLRSNLPEIPFARSFEEATELTVLRFITPMCLWKTMRYLNIGSEKRLKKSIKHVDEFAEHVIRTRKQELAGHHNDNSQRRSDLLTVFMGLKDDNDRAYSDKFLRDICVNFILAGRDTSSVAMSWFFWLLHKNPAVEDKILEEILDLVRERDEEEMKVDEDFIFKPEEIKKMDYLQAALSEALRLYPSVPIDHKEVVEDDILPDGTVLKKGTKVLYAMYAMGRMEGIWGKDCREFKPERWLREGRFMSESAYKFAAFNGGPRLCIGREFAYYQMKFVAAAIIVRYRVQVVEGHPVAPRLALTLFMKHGLRVNLIKREAYVSSISF